MDGLELAISHKQTDLPQPFLQEVPLASSRLPDPSPFDIDSFFNEWNASQPIEKMAEKKDAFTNVMHSFTRPFIAQGYNTLAALNRGSASFYAHLDSIVEFIELSGMGKKEGLFEKMAQISAEKADYWRERAEKVGINFFDELVSEAVGGFVPGVTQFSMDVASGYTFPYMGGATEAYKKGESPFIGGILEAAKTATLAGLFKMMGPLKKYLQAPIMGTIFGIQEMEIAPEGQKLRVFGKGFGIGVAYSLTSPGGRLGLNEIAENLKPEIAKAAELAKTGKTVLISQRGAIGEKPKVSREESKYLELDQEFIDFRNRLIKGETLSDVELKRYEDLKFEVPYWMGKAGISGKEVKPTEKVEGIPVYRATTEPFNPELMKGEIYVSPYEDIASNFKRKGQTVEKLYLDKDSKILRYEDIPEEIRNIKDWDTYSPAVAKYAKEQGYDAVYSTPAPTELLEETGVPKYQTEITIVNPKKLNPEAKIEGVKEPEARPRKFLKTVEEASETAPEIKERLEEIQREEPQDYYVQPNKESLEKASKRIETEGIDKTVDYVFSPSELNAEKGATFISLMDKFQKEGDFDRAIQMVEAYDMQLREAGRFIQAASIWNKLSPTGFIRWADKQLESTKSKYSWADTIIGNKPESFSLNKEEKQTIFDKMSEINKMPDGIEKTDATLQVIDIVAKKVPPSVSEMIDAYRYSNMLSSPRTHMRNIGENIFNTFVKRPIDITTRGAYDFVKSSLTGSNRQAYVMDTPAYMKASINSIPNALNAFMTSWRMETGAEIRKPEVGIEVKGEFQRARAKELPSALTIVPRFMEASDKFNSALIGAGEFAIQKRRGATDAEAYKRGSELAEKYLYREKLDPNDPDLSYFSQVLSSLGKMITDTRKLPGLGTLSKWFVPFIKTPINKGIQMIESSPLGLARAKFDQEAMAKIMAGSIFTGLGAMFALQGDTTWSSPSNPKEKELFYASGRKPFSVRIGNNWIPIWYLGPFALAFGLPMAVKYYVQDEKKALTQDGIEKLLAIAEGTAQFIGSQTSTQSIGALFSALNGDIDFRFASQTAFTVGQIIPGQSLIRYINTILDPVYRKPKGFLENIEKDLPFLSQKLQERQTPLFEPSIREIANYFLPYDVGIVKPIYENILPFQKYEIRQKYLQNKVDELSRKVRSGEMTVEDSMKEMMEIIKVSPKPLEQLGEELLKQ